MKKEPSIDPRMEQWLETATRGLSDRAAGRARDELLDHWLEALDELDADGISHDDAVTQVLESFGDPGKMGKSLRRADLRPWEARFVKDLRTPQTFRQPLSAISLICHVALIPTFIFVNWDSIGDPWWQDGVFVSCLSLMTTGLFAMFWLGSRLAMADRLRPALASSVFGSWIFYAALTIGTDIMLRGRSFGRAMVYFAILACATLLVLHLWPKLGRKSIS